MDIHPTALVADGAKLGEGCTIGAFCVVGPEVELGAGCQLHAHVVVDGKTRLGPLCEVFPFSVLGTAPQDKKLHRRDAGRLVIGARNCIREHVTIHTGTPFGGGVTTVGDDNMLLASAHIGHDSRVGSNVVFTNGAMVAGHTVVGDNVVLGAMVGVHQFARVGRLAMIGAGAMVSRDAPPYALVQGDRARLVGVNVVGLKRAGLSQADVAVIKRCYRQLFWRHGVLEERMRGVRATFGEIGSVSEILSFVADTRRGICKPRGRFDVGNERDTVED